MRQKSDFRAGFCGGLHAPVHCTDRTLDVLFAPLQAGKAVKMLSSVPVFGVLAAPIGTVLKVGDGVFQTRRLEKVGLL